jgi:hypothetical protein
MERHKFTVTEWVFIESTCSFKVNFSIVSQEKEDCEFYTLTVPYNFEEPGVFAQKAHSLMVLYVNNTRNLEECKKLLSEFTFIDSVRPSVNNENTEEEEKD